MAVDLLGKTANYTDIVSVCDDFEVPLIEDAAEALGATHRGRPAGSFGRAAALSFNGNKIMTTSGGGMIVTDDEELADHARFLSTQAREPVAHYEHRHVGYNYRLSNILAAIGRAQLERLPTMIERRRQIRMTYKELVADFDGVRVLGGADDDEANCWLTALLIDPAIAGISAARVIEALDTSDIEARPLWKPMHQQPIFADAGRLVHGVSEKLFESGLTLPSGSALQHGQVQSVCEIVRTALGRCD